MINYKRTQHLNQFLLTVPNISTICNSLATHFLPGFNIKHLRLSWLSPEDELEIIGEYGYLQSADEADPNGVQIGRIVPSKIWRSATDNESIVLGLRMKETQWSPDFRHYVLPMVSSGLTLGFVSFCFEPGMDDQERIIDFEAIIENYGSTLTLYFKLERELRRREMQLIELESLRRVTSAMQAARFAALSSREAQIMHEMAEGRTNKEIAEIVGFSEATIRAEISEIYRILHIHDRGEAVALWRARVK
tara:strand:- start:1534 stop:2280 length:747 start_codon:yes stop_codon:yes gene_type:complete